MAQEENKKTKGPPKKKLKFKTVIQGTRVKEFVDSLEKGSPTDDEIDSLKPFYFDAVMEDDETHVMFKVDMLSEKDYKKFLKSFSMIKGNIESVLNNVQDFIERNKDKNTKQENPDKDVKISKMVYGLLKDNDYFQNSFYMTLSRFVTCLNPEILTGNLLYSITKVKYKIEISKQQFYTLFMELYNESHPVIEHFISDVPLIDKTQDELQKEYEDSLTELSKQRINNTISHSEYIKKITDLEKELSIYSNYKSYIESSIIPELKKMPLAMIKDLVEDLINIKVSDFLKNISIDKLIPIFYKILDYNEYKVKKKLQQIGGQIQNLTAQRSGTTYSSGKSLITVRTGEGQLPELSYSVQ